MAWDKFLRESRPVSCIAIDMIRILLFLALLSQPAFAKELPLSDGPVEVAVRNLAPGDFLWSEKVSPEGPVTALISLPLQRVYVYRNGVIIGISSVSTGKPGHETPTGVFTILQKARDHKSNLYNDAPMPFMQRLTWDGIALHAGNLPGHPASHGCIRLPDAFAEKLFAVTSLGITVIVADSADVPRLAASKGEGSAMSGETDIAGDALWRPWLQEKGPISILVSAADHQLRVVRNAVEIARAPVRLERAVELTEVYSLQRANADRDEFQWVRVPIAAEDSGGQVAPEERAKLVLNEDFRQKLASILTPGTTVVVTPDSLSSASYDKTIQVLAPED